MPPIAVAVDVVVWMCDIFLRRARCGATAEEAAFAGVRCPVKPRRAVAVRLWRHSLNLTVVGLLTGHLTAGRVFWLELRDNRFQTIADERNLVKSRPTESNVHLVELLTQMRSRSSPPGIIRPNHSARVALAS